jgi:hypothetical protein
MPTCHHEGPEGGSPIDSRVFKLAWGLAVLTLMTVLLLHGVPPDVVLPFISLLPKSRDFDKPGYPELPSSN